MLLTAVCRRVSFTVGGRFSLSSEISSNCQNYSLKWRTNCSVVPLKLSSRTVLVTYWVSLLFSEAPFEDVLICSLSSLQNYLSISVGQVSSDNGLSHVSLKVSIKDTKHKGSFGFKEFLLLRFTTLSIDGVQDLIALMGLGNYEKASLEAIKVSFIFEGRVYSYLSHNTIFRAHLLYCCC